MAPVVGWGGSNDRDHGDAWRFQGSREDSGGRTAVRPRWIDGNAVYLGRAP